MTSPIEESPIMEPAIKEPPGEEPLIEEPKVEKPKRKKSKIEKPKIEKPKIEGPKIEGPKIEGPKIENLKSFDPFADADDVVLKHQKIHIRAQSGPGPAKRTPDGNKPHMVTTVEGLPEKFDKNKILGVLKKKLACAGKVVDDKDWGEVIQVQGDYRTEIAEWLCSKDGLEISKELIGFHG